MDRRRPARRPLSVSVGFLRFWSRNRVIREKRCVVVFLPWQMQWVRLGYSIIVNGLFAATSALISISLFW